MRRCNLPHRLYSNVSTRRLIPTTSARPSGGLCSTAQILRATCAECMAKILCALGIHYRQPAHGERASGDCLEG